MSIPSNFKSAVHRKDIKYVRVMILDTLTVSMNMSKTKQLLSYAEEHIADSLYDPHDGGELVTDQSKWDKRYMRHLMSVILKNFSKDRFYHMLEIGGHIMESGSDASFNKKMAKVKNILIAIGVGGGIITVAIGYFAKQQAMVNVGIGMCLVTGAVLFTSKRTPSDWID